MASDDGVIGEEDRWRLLLGREPEKLAPGGARAARALEEMYGSGRGEGSRSELGDRESSYPEARQWSAEIEALFGDEVREEVLGLAAERGNAAALLELDPEQTRPSIELLERLLSLRGTLPESAMPRVRRLIERVVEELVRDLSARLRPALQGINSPQPTSRRGGRLDLPRTIARNLKTARTNEEGRTELIAERLVFKTKSKRSIEWQVMLVVDVSGSMEASVIYSAMMAAILSRVPWLSVSFLAFNTEVIDLTDRVADPLELLLEVEVGGGTHIAKALRHARSMIAAPQRTILILLTDFEEGFATHGLLAEVRAICESGVKALGLAALDDTGQARYVKSIAERVAGAGMPVAALSPLQLARWIGERIR